MGVLCLLLLCGTVMLLAIAAEKPYTEAEAMACCDRVGIAGSKECSRSGFLAGAEQQSAKMKAQSGLDQLASSPRLVAFIRQLMQPALSTLLRDNGGKIAAQENCMSRGEDHTACCTPKGMKR